MIKKIIILAILVAGGYVGYRIWSNLSEKEKAVVSSKLDKTVDGAKKLLDKTADKLTDTAKGAIDDMDKDGDKSKRTPKAKDPKEKSDTPPAEKQDSKPSE